MEVTGAACRAANYSSEQTLQGSSKLELNIITFIDGTIKQISLRRRALEWRLLSI